jgi:hypothetical protein
LRRPFEVSPEELADNIDAFVDVTFADIQSTFLFVPRGSSFVEYPRFREGYEVLKRATSAFRDFAPDPVWAAMREDAMAFVVVRTILGFKPGDLAQLAREEVGADVNENAARSLDVRCRIQRDFVEQSAIKADVHGERLRAMVEVACEYIEAGAPETDAKTIHRLEKVDTRDGLLSLQSVADNDVPYPVLLYERLLGAPFGTLRNSVSRLVGGVMESAVARRLKDAHVSFRHEARPSPKLGFERAPDFLIPDELAPKVAIEAKIASDDGSASNEVNHLINLARSERERAASGKDARQLIACIDGAGFAVRRREMRELLLALGGKVFTLDTLDQLISHSDLARYASENQETDG